MKVNTDGVLLGAWTDVQGAESILDVGTGTGLIAIMLAQRSAAVIDAVEIDATACSQAEENISNCPWRERIRLHHMPFQEYVSRSTVKFDLVVCNPPYFVNSLRPPDAARSAARHDEKLSYESLIFHSSRILNENGKISVILPAQASETILSIAWFNRLYPERIVHVRSKPERKPTRVLLELARKQCSNPSIAEMSIMNAGSAGYSQEFSRLTRDFYL